MNNTINVHTGDTCRTPKNHMLHTEGVDAADAFVVGWGKPVIFSRVKRAPSPKLSGVPRNEFGVAVGHGKAYSSVWVLAPGRSNYSIVLRKHVREIRLGVQKQMSMLEGQSYLPVRNAAGEIVLTTRGDSGVLGKQFALNCNEDLGEELETEDVPISEFSSTIEYQRITADTVEKHQFATESPGDETLLDDALDEVLEEEVFIKQETGEVCDSSGNIVDTQALVQSESGEVAALGDLVQAQTQQGRYSGAQRSRRSNAETLPERFLVQSVEAAQINVPGPYCPDMSELVVRAAVSHDEFMRRNPTNSQAMKGPDQEKWRAADLKELVSLTEEQPGRIGPTMCEIQRHEVPPGQPILPITKQRKIKSNGTYKSRFCVMGNLEHFEGPTFASTASKKTVWLFFALSTRLGLKNRFFDVTGAFCHERPKRLIIVELDGKYYRLMYSLYGTADAPRLFQDGLVDHLRAGGYIQSAWDQCLFYKWISILVYIYIMFHVDDFDTAGTDEGIIDEFEAHMKKKYDITSNTDGVFLGVEITPHGPHHSIFRKPSRLQNIFDKYLPAGPFLPLPKGPMKISYVKGFVIEDSPLANVKTYRSMIGAIMQLVDVRPDIAFPVAKAAGRQCTPREKDEEALIVLIHYLYATRSKGIVLRRGDHKSAQLMLTLQAFTDCSHNCHGDGKSQYGASFRLVAAGEEERDFTSTGHFYSKSHKSSVVDLNVCQGEIGGTVAVTKDVIFFRGVLKEFHQEQVKATELFGDNTSAISLGTSYNGNHKKVRYMLPLITWIMEQTKAGVVKLCEMVGKILAPDNLTKIGSGTEWQYKEDQLLGTVGKTHIREV